MQPVYLYRSEIDINKWNRCIQNARFSCIYTYSWYLDIVSPQWDAIVLQDSEEYIAVMPLPLQRRWFMTIIAQPFYCQYLGIFTTKEINESLIESFLAVVLKKRYYISSYSFHPALFHLLRKSPLLNKSFIWKECYTEFLCFEPAINQVTPYSKDRIKNLRQAIKFDWELEDSNNIEPLIDLFKYNHEPTFINGIHPQSYHWLKAVYDGLKEKATIWYAKKSNYIHAGILIVHYNQQHYYLFNAADAIGRKFNARSWLLDLYLRKIRNEANFFDFESAQKPSIREHYQSFGAATEPFITIRKNTLPFPFNAFQEARIAMSSTTI